MSKSIAVVGDVDRLYILKRLGIAEKDFDKARNEFAEAWEVACKYCEKEKGVPIFNCEYCPLVNTAENFRIYND